MKAFLCAIACFLAPFAGFLSADQVTLVNGDRVTGAVVKGDEKSLILDTKAMGTVTVARGEITAIRSDQPLHLGLSDGQTLVGTLSTTDGKVSVETRTSGTVIVDLGAIGTIRSAGEQAAHEAEIERYRDPGLLDLWAGSVDLGLSLTSGNSSNLNFALGGSAVRQTKRDKISLYVASVYSRSEVAGITTTTTANAVRGGGRYELFLNDRLNVFGFGDLEHDVFQQLDLRVVLGGGLGYYVVKSKRTQFQVFGGGNLNKEYFTDGLRRTTGELLVGQDLTAKLSDRFSLTERFVAFPNLSEGGEYRLAFDASALTTLKKWLGWHITFSDRFLSDPPAGSVRNDILLTTGLRFTFKK
ncbi:MAG: DUF481 domain-containing protein [Acidobacteria bacterium]|nr:DUF481 domain-containing protein [Acidobacteriota bacterium]